MVDGDAQSTARWEVCCFIMLYSDPGLEKWRINQIISLKTEWYVNMKDHITLEGGLFPILLPFIRLDGRHVINGWVRHEPMLYFNLLLLIWRTRLMIRNSNAMIESGNVHMSILYFSTLIKRNNQVYHKYKLILSNPCFPLYVITLYGTSDKILSI